MALLLHEDSLYIHLSWGRQGRTAPARSLPQVDPDKSPSGGPDLWHF